ncbi:hypothetical protein GEV33_011553 [Tenebrio molitor]|uniref:Uncharacterized protein n=1 Tax=Tenebrio molitor TaxID=7067 RepID=A0A8J6L9Q4_TENMO|nr:hypothetical protein GEV33_011553 [Tenebrio molitor]
MTILDLRARRDSSLVVSLAPLPFVVICGIKRESNQKRRGVGKPPPVVRAPKVVEAIFLWLVPNTRAKSNVSGPLCGTVGWRSRSCSRPNGKLQHRAGAFFFIIASKEKRLHIKHASQHPSVQQRGRYGPTTSACSSRLVTEECRWAVNGSILSPGYLFLRGRRHNGPD